MQKTSFICLTILLSASSLIFTSESPKKSQHCCTPAGDSPTAQTSPHFPLGIPTHKTAVTQTESNHLLENIEAQTDLAFGGHNTATYVYPFPSAGFGIFTNQAQEATAPASQTPRATAPASDSSIPSVHKQPKPFGSDSSTSQPTGFDYMGTKEEEEQLQRAQLPTATSAQPGFLARWVPAFLRGRTHKQPASLQSQIDQSFFEEIQLCITNGQPIHLVVEKFEKQQNGTGIRYLDAMINFFMENKQQPQVMSLRVNAHNEGLFALLPKPTQQRCDSFLSLAHKTNTDHIHALLTTLAMDQELLQKIAQQGQADPSLSPQQIRIANFAQLQHHAKIAVTALLKKQNTSTTDSPREDL